MANGRRRQQPDRHMSGEARAASPPPAARPGRTNSSTWAHTASRPSSCPSYSAGRPQPHPPPLSYTSLLTHTYPPAAAAPHTTTPQATPLYPPSHCGQRPTGDEKRLRRARPTRSPPRPPTPTLRQEAVVPPPPPHPWHGCGLAAPPRALNVLNSHAERRSTHRTSPRMGRPNWRPTTDRANASRTPPLSVTDLRSAAPLSALLPRPPPPPPPGGGSARANADDHAA